MLSRRHLVLLMPVDGDRKLKIIELIDPYQCIVPLFVAYHHCVQSFHLRQCPDNVQSKIWNRLYRIAMNGQTAQFLQMLQLNDTFQIFQFITMQIQGFELWEVDEIVIKVCKHVML